MSRPHESHDQLRLPQPGVPSGDTLGAIGKVSVGETQVTPVPEQYSGFDVTSLSPTMRLTSEQADMIRVMASRAGSEIGGTDIRKLAGLGSILPTKQTFQRLLNKLRNDPIWSELLRDNGKSGRFKLWSIDKERLETELRMHGTSLDRVGEAAPPGEDISETDHVVPAQSKLSDTQRAALQRLNERGEARRMAKYLEEAARADRRKKKPRN